MTSPPFYTQKDSNADCSGELRSRRMMASQPLARPWGELLIHVGMLKPTCPGRAPPCPPSVPPADDIV